VKNANDRIFELRRRVWITHYYYWVTMWPALSWFDTSVSTALYQYGRSRGSNPIQAWNFFRLRF